MSQFTMEWANAQNAKRLKKHAPETRTEIPDAKPCERSSPLEGNSKREARSAGCPLVRFTLCRVKLLDVDAKYASVKDLLDGLTIAGIIHGDKEGQVILQVEQTKVAHYEDERTEIDIQLA